MGLAVVRGTDRELAQAFAVAPQRPDMPVAVTVRLEDQVSAVGRERGLAVVAQTVGELRRFDVADILMPQGALQIEDDPTAVGRQYGSHVGAFGELERNPLGLCGSDAE